MVKTIRHVREHGPHHSLWCLCPGEQFAEIKPDLANRLHVDRTRKEQQWTRQ